MKIHWLCTQNKGKCCGCKPHDDCTKFVIERTDGSVWCGFKPDYMGGIKSINKFINDTKPWKK
jgi:hypothetical protein